MRIEPRKGFPDDQRARVAALYWEAFSGKLGGVLGPEAKGRAFFASILNPDFAISVMSGDGVVLGVAGFKTREGGLAEGTLRDMQQVYGPLGGLWRGLVMETLTRSIGPELLQMDGIFVSAAARGHGIGGTLVDAIVAEARARDLAGVRLDVIENNAAARRLYERKGFVATGEDRLGPLKWVFGFARSTRMELRF